MNTLKPKSVSLQLASADKRWLYWFWAGLLIAIVLIATAAALHHFAVASRCILGAVGLLLVLFVILSLLLDKRRTGIHLVGEPVVELPLRQLKFDLQASWPTITDNSNDSKFPGFSRRFQLPGPVAFTILLSVVINGVLVAENVQHVWTRSAPDLNHPEQVCVKLNKLSLTYVDRLVIKVHSSQSSSA
jgi:hypothetical protein